jgi:hypothetical protein
MRVGTFTEVTVVRPYGEAIRKKVFAILESCGLNVAQKHVIPPSTSDPEVLSILRSRPGHVLLLPFHGHLDATKKIVNGISLFRKIRDELPELAARAPVLMPVENHSASVVESLVSLLGASTILLMPESSLAQGEAMAEKVRGHLAHCARLT